MKPNDEQVNKILEKIPHDELKQFIREQTEHNSPLRNLFLSSFAHQSARDSKEMYAAQVRYILSAMTDRGGFISWRQSGAVGQAVGKLVNRAKEHVDRKNYKSAIFICAAVMEEMTVASEFADDSSGAIGGNIEDAFELLSGMADEKLPEEIRVQLLEYCLSAFKEEIYFGSGWDLSLLNIASKIINNDAEEQRITAYLDGAQSSNYVEKDFQNIRFNIIKRTKGEEEVDKFIEQNRANSDIRQEAIARAVSNKEYEKAMGIAKEGIKSDENNYGLVMKWNNALLEIAQAKGDKEKIIEYARRLLLLTANTIRKQDYYQLLKNTVPPETWIVFVEEIVGDIAAKNQREDFYLLAEICTKEEWWSRLLELLKQNPTLNQIEYCEKYLVKDFADELVLLYENEVVKYVENNMGKNHYQSACVYLKRMINLGGGKTVEKMVSNFKKQYARRSAFMEALKGI